MSPFLTTSFPVFPLFRFCSSLFSFYTPSSSISLSFYLPHWNIWEILWNNDTTIFVFFCYLFSLFLYLFSLFFLVFLSFFLSVFLVSFCSFSPPSLSISTSSFFLSLLFLFAISSFIFWMPLHHFLLVFLLFLVSLSPLMFFFLYLSCCSFSAFLFFAFLSVYFTIITRVLPFYLSLLIDFFHSYLLFSTKFFICFTSLPFLVISFSVYFQFLYPLFYIFLLLSPPLNHGRHCDIIWHKCHIKSIFRCHRLSTSKKDKFNKNYLQRDCSFHILSSSVLAAFVPSTSTKFIFKLRWL